MGEPYSTVARFQHRTKKADKSLYIGDFLYIEKVHPIIWALNHGKYKI